jgi:sugar phosphate permease
VSDPGGEERAAGAGRVDARALAVAFAVTWLAYASYYLCRKGFSVAKKPMVGALGLGEYELVFIDNALLAAYAVGQFASGWAGDRVGARRLVGWGMLASAAACAAFGAASHALALMVLFALNGAAQSTGWPGTVRAMAEWTAPAGRGRVMGLWATCYQVGGLAATAAATWLVVHVHWRAAFVAPAVWVAAVGVLVLATLRPGPFRAGADRGGERVSGGSTAAGAQRALARDPTVWCYGAAYFVLKLVRYSLLFWLPYYFAEARGHDVATSGYLSTSFELGGVAGTIAVGALSDRYLHRVPRSGWVAGCLVSCAGALWLFARVAAAGPAATYAAMALVGVLLFAADSLLSGAAAQDLGGPGAAGLAAGIVNGVGSVGSLCAGFVTVGLKRAYGWDAVFVAFVVASLVGALLLWPTLRVTSGASRALVSGGPAAERERPGSQGRSGE